MEKGKKFGQVAWRVLFLMGVAGAIARAIYLASV